MQCRSFPKGIFAACLAAAFLAPEASAGAKPEQDGSAASQGKRQAAEEVRDSLRTEAFRGADQDADGHLSAAEFAELPALMAALRRQRIFERLDADGDGLLKLEEFGSAAKRNSQAGRPWRTRIRRPWGR